MSKIPPKSPESSSFCPKCRVRAKWSESKRNLCYWCDTGKAVEKSPEPNPKKGRK